MPVDNVLGDAELGREHAQAYAAHAQRLDASTVSMRTKSALCGAIWSLARHGLETLPSYANFRRAIQPQNWRKVKLTLDVSLLLLMQCPGVSHNVLWYPCVS